MTLIQMNNFLNIRQPYFQRPSQPSQSWRVFEHDNVKVQQPTSNTGSMWTNYLAPPPQPSNMSSKTDDVILLDQDPHVLLVLPPQSSMPFLATENEARRNEGSRWDQQSPLQKPLPVNDFDDRESVKTPMSDDNVIIIGDCAESDKKLSPMSEYSKLIHTEESKHVSRSVSPPRVTRNRQRSPTPSKKLSPIPQHRQLRIKSFENDIYQCLYDDLLNKYSKCDGSNQNRRDREHHYSHQRTHSPERRRSAYRSRSPLERRRERSSIVNRRRSRSPAIRRRSRSPLTRRRSRSPVNRRRSRTPIERYRESSEHRRSPTPRRRVSPAVSHHRSPNSRRWSRSFVAASNHRSSRDRGNTKRLPEVRSISSREGLKKLNDKSSKSNSDTSSSNTEEDPLQAFAKNFDAEEFRKKLQRKMMSKLKEKIAKETQQQEEQSLNILSEKCEAVTPGPSSTDIQLHYNHSTENVDEHDYPPNIMVSESDIEIEGPSQKTTVEEDCDTDQASFPGDDAFADIELSDAETPPYPWYINSPIQHEISQKFLELSKLDGFKYDQRPQQPVQDGIIRTFPVKKRGLIVNEYQKRAVHYDNIFEDTPNSTLYAPLARPSSNSRFQSMVKQSGKGFVIRGHGTLSWIRRDKYTDTNSVTQPPTIPDHTSFTNGYTNHHECFDFIQNKKCQAGALCKFDHDGDTSHRQKSFCYRFLNGLCRNGNDCPDGCHTLLPHQLPICDHFLRMSCPYKTGCPFLHVKHTDNTATCIYFNKGRCLSAFPCPYVHRYTQTFVRERCKHLGNSKEDLQQAEETESINFNDIVPLEWYQ